MAAKKENFEKSLERLERIVAQLESGDLPLEKGVALYKEGLDLAGACRKRLDEAKMEISRVTEKGLAAFDVADAAEGGETNGDAGVDDD